MFLYCKLVLTNNDKDMDTTIINNHRQRAKVAYLEAMQMAERKLAKSHSSDRIEKAKVLLDLAELHLLVNDVRTTEKELTEALSIFLCANSADVNVCSAYVVYILKTLAGIHECNGRKKEAKTELSDALKLEQKLKNKSYES